MRIILLVILWVVVNGQNYKRIGYLPEGGTSVTILPIKGYDANHNGFPEIYYHPYRYLQPAVIRIWEYKNFNHYFLVGDSIRDYIFINLGSFDNDDKSDLLAWGGGHFYVLESPSPDSYPTRQVWSSDSTYFAFGGIHVADLDQDGRMDFLFSNALGGIYVYENYGDNSYVLVWDTVLGSNYNFTSGDFDGDGLIEFPSGNVGGGSWVYECCGDNRYRPISQLDNPSNSHDIFFGNDLDQDGKLEFIISSAPGVGGSRAYQFRVYEAVGDNDYEVSYTSDIIYRPYNLGVGRGSYCGDVDLDGQDEIIWAIEDNWYIYKAFGNNNFQRIFTAYPDYNWHNETRVYVYDLNGNGYPEIIETGGTNGTGPNDSTETVIWEIEAVRLLYPNGGEVFNPGDTVEIKWRTFDPPGCDSLSLFFSADSGYTYDTIMTGIPASETTYNWIVPDTTSAQCMLMIWAYGPGVGWDFTDSVFAIGVGISERKSHKLRELKIYPNPSHGLINLALPADVINLTLFDASGRLIHHLSPSPHLQFTLPPGIYFLKIETEAGPIHHKILILK
ncbi:hypothetical protein DRP53_03300 [candidate division WOR-3 bacterium]|uniref:Secretion system C-terminal sorting domain-containing protein n=1 Tax=candidate division WOR-3 bacterium TaxID=2052148 RepID=A0A660SJG0_UNCW3|nr:MAG: hypothetical protein DRP53_03300 [candidate division WOR-3 bacterium]